MFQGTTKKQIQILNNTNYSIHVYEIQVSSIPHLYRYFDILMLGFSTKIGLMNRNLWITS
ncbi:hypothetical protein GCM10008014_29020 [Paenibacillus silvae]|uniref:Uncharacterized protein n=1 Tax=Paenibacillus silvae TaxID=1325358 RepID=A0ABQ1ZE84_9BACL|nr:hypothetical protein GCM10008014_29020 [Paenibacillus silvae]